MVYTPETYGFHTTRYVPSKLSVTRARVCDGPRIATKKVSPPEVRLRPFSSHASIQKYDACRTVASSRPLPRTLHLLAPVFGSRYLLKPGMLSSSSSASSSRAEYPYIVPRRIMLLLEPIFLSAVLTWVRLSFSKPSSSRSTSRISDEVRSSPSSNAASRIRATAAITSISASAGFLPKDTRAAPPSICSRA